MPNREAFKISPGILSDPRMEALWCCDPIVHQAMYPYFHGQCDLETALKEAVIALAAAKDAYLHELQMAEYLSIKPIIVEKK